jgi:uncharacterized membrane protein YesL
MWQHIMVSVCLRSVCALFMFISYIYIFCFNRHYNTSGFRPAQLSLIILSRKVLQSAVTSGTSNPQLGGEPGI